MRCKTVLLATTLFISIFLTLSFSSVYAKDVRGVTDNTIKVGVIGGFSGPAAWATVPIMDAVKNYMRDVDERGGIHGRKMKFIVEDSHYTVPRSLAGFKKLLYKDKIFALLIGSDSGSMKLLEGRCDKNKIPFFTSALSDTMMPPIAPFSRYTFFALGAYSDGMKMTFDHIFNDLGDKKPRIAYVGPDNEFGKAGLKVCKDYAGLHGFELTNSEVLSPGAMDATSQVLNTKRAKADYVLIHNFPGATAAFMRDAYKFAYVPKNFFGTPLALDLAVIKMAGKAAKNFIDSSYFSLWYMDTPEMKKLREVTLRYEPGTEKPYRNWCYTQGWVIAMLLERGIKGAGKELTPEGMVKELESLKEFSTGGLTGPYTCTSTDHHGFKYNRLYKPDLEKGLFIPFTDWRKVNLP